MRRVIGTPRTAVAAAVVMLALMTVLMFHSAWDDTATSDDNVALISGYSYLRTQEYRLEPQNPPLIKDLAAVPLLFMSIHQPWDHKSWVEDGDPDTLGRVFLYHSGNDADAILRAAKAPMILFAAGFGAVLFWWTRKEFGDSAALLTMFLYTFSPTFLAHGRFVATDLGATAGFFIGIIAFLRFLKAPTLRNGLFAGLALGFALLTKFSTVALIPIFLFLAVAWVVAKVIPAHRRLLRIRRLASGFAVAFRPPQRAFFRTLGRTLGQTVAIIAVAYAVLYPMYLHHIWNFEPARQVAIAEAHRDLYGLGGTAKDIVIWASDKSVLRPWAAHFLGLLVALKASHWGQAVFFWGTVYNTGMRIYFPAAYLVKEALALHVLTLAALLFVGYQFIQAPRRPRQWRRWLAEHFTEFAFLVVIAVYWAALIRSNMNIGVRHLLPAFPFTFILVSNQIVRLYARLRRPAAVWSFRAVLCSLLAWQAVSVLRVHPSYLAYFNELAGGADGGWRYLNDSNLDWGQELRRLADYVEAKNIPGIRVDFFGPGDITYYLKEKYLGGVGCGELPKGWIAISAMVYPGAPWNATCDYRQKLPIETRADHIGYSMFIFHVE